ncbi:hypothetical protein [Bacillus sp. THAF10]|nr:hypothetical protein [Bacillus sp. THAF10]
MNDKMIGGKLMTKNDSKEQQQQRKNQVESTPGQEDKKLKGPNRPST